MCSCLKIILRNLWYDSKSKHWRIEQARILTLRLRILIGLIVIPDRYRSSTLTQITTACSYTPRDSSFTAILRQLVKRGLRSSIKRCGAVWQASEYTFTCFVDLEPGPSSERRTRLFCSPPIFIDLEGTWDISKRKMLKNKQIDANG
jgi:hypothetical protein